MVIIIGRPRTGPKCIGGTLALLKPAGGADLNANGGVRARSWPEKERLVVGLVQNY